MSSFSPAPAPSPTADDDTSFTPPPPPPPSPTSIPSRPPPPSPPFPTSPPSPPFPTSPPSRPSPPSQPSQSSPPPPGSSKGGAGSGASSGAGAVVGISIGVVAVLLVLVLVLVICLCKKKRRRDEEASVGPKADHQQNASQPSDGAMRSLPPQQPFMSSGGSGGSYSNSFTYEELSRATNGFSETNLLGQGGFGYVFKGILGDGKEVAVKQLKAGSGQGEREFQAEVEIISRVHHRNLVTLVGYCIADAQRLLVYEFVPNNTLEFHLHGKGRPPLDWSSRLKIAVGSAKALTYLHENCHPKIIHRDIKAANILIDFKFEAKVADFGLAKLVSDINTHVSTRIMGTFGYLAPEYAASGKLTEKSDVYSFGVILLELITGQLPFDPNNKSQDDNLVDWALPLLNQASEKGNFEGLADTKMNNEYDIEEMARMVACAVACVHPRARHRPTMDQVVRVLCGNVLPSELEKGIKPVKSSWTDYDTSENNEDIKNIEALANLIYNDSSENSNTTSDIGLQSSGSSGMGGLMQFVL